MKNCDKIKQLCCLASLEKTSFFNLRSLSQAARKLSYLTGFTLIELMVVVVIVGIMAAVAIPNYRATREKAYDREAVAALRLVRAANRQYYAASEHYFPAGGTEDDVVSINTNMTLDLNENLWDYAITNLPGGNFQVTARRAGRTWLVDSTGAPPSCSPATLCYN